MLLKMTDNTAKLSECDGLQILIRVIFAFDMDFNIILEDTSNIKMDNKF